MGSSGESTSSSTELGWKEGYNLTAKAAQRAAAEKGGRKRHLESRTFFTWFCDNLDPSQDDVAEVIKDDLWPNPLQYFLVPDIEVDNNGEEEELEDEEEVDENVVVMEEEEGEEEDEEGGEEEGEGDDK